MRHGRVTHGYPIFLGPASLGDEWWGCLGMVIPGRCHAMPRFSFFLYTSFFLLWGSLALFEASHFTFLARSVVGTPFLKIFLRGQTCWGSITMHQCFACQRRRVPSTIQSAWQKPGPSRIKLLSSQVNQISGYQSQQLMAWFALRDADQLMNL